MNRQTYPVHCGLCLATLPHTSPVKGSTGICSVCFEQHFGKIQKDPGGRIKVGSFYNDPPWTDEVSDRRAIIEGARPRRPRPNDFIDGFLIGGAVAILLGILAEYIFHLHKL